MFDTPSVVHAWFSLVVIGPIRLVLGVTASDPLTLTGAAALLMFTTVVASYLPARRASRIDPALVLRSE